MSRVADMTRLRQLTLGQLRDRRDAVIAAATRPSPASLYLYDAKSRAKLDLIAWVVTEKLRDLKKTSAPPPRSAPPRYDDIYAAGTDALEGL